MLFLYNASMKPFIVAARFPHTLQAIPSDANLATSPTGLMRTGVTSLPTEQQLLTMTLFAILDSKFKYLKSQLPLYTLIFVLMDTGTSELQMALRSHLVESLPSFKNDALPTT